MATTVRMRAAYNRYQDRVGDLVQVLCHNIVATRHRDRRLPISKIAALVRSSVYIWLSAALEIYVQEINTALLMEIEKRRIKIRNSNPVLLAISEYASFDALKDLRGLKMWAKRSEITVRGQSSDLLVFQEKITPVDGKTLRFEHMETIWRIFGFDGDCIPSHLHRMAMEDVAEKRNDLAHGRENPVSAGISMNTVDLNNLVKRYEEIGGHLLGACSTFLENKRHLRPRKGGMQ